MIDGRRFGTVVYLVVVLLVTFASSKVAVAQQQGASNPPVSPLVRVLHAKGILTDEDMAQINQASSSGEADQRLAKLLLSKGVISQADYDQTMAAGTFVNASNADTAGAHVVSAVYHVPGNAPTPVPELAPVPTIAATVVHTTAPADQTASAAPAVIPAITPTRVFPVGGLLREGLKPAFSIGTLRVTPYGFIKATFVRDSSSPGGDDFPCPDS